MGVSVTTIPMRPLEDGFLLKLAKTDRAEHLTLVNTCQEFWRSVVPDAYRPQARPSLLFARRPTSGRRSATRFGVPLHDPTIGLVDALSNCAAVDAVLLRGSVALGMYDDASDDDLEIVLSASCGGVDGHTERRLALVWPKSGKGGIVCDAFLTTADELVTRATSALDVDRWPYRQVKILHVRQPAVLHLLERVASMPRSFRTARLRHGVVDMTFACERGRRCARRGQDVERILLVARGARALNRVLFALEWQWVPLDHWLTFGLSRLSDPADCAAFCREAIETGSIDPLHEATERLRVYLSRTGEPSGWTHNELLSVIRRPDGHRERAIHGLC